MAPVTTLAAPAVDPVGLATVFKALGSMRLRKRLGDDEHDPRWIKAVRGLGYQFTVPPAVTSDVPPQIAPSPRSPDVHTV